MYDFIIAIYNIFVLLKKNNDMNNIINNITVVSFVT